eukprot:Gregarina_sp_Poly_1__4774@NODE_2547_length_2001_cov_32_055326_g1618_i0_p2_GENE_NODE_2547_length_2001_cov_32_055326_g1618_i0NODE_2547_length_2001_cov_32_055326_g1618_i0_p2_ORF_typecomplete_len178_score21_32_NODE_2547_length_2001_cov_32_055326_g1618_i08891422
MEGIWVGVEGALFRSVSAAARRSPKMEGIESSFESKELSTTTWLKSKGVTGTARTTEGGRDLTSSLKGLPPSAEASFTSGGTYEEPRGSNFSIGLFRCSSNLEAVSEFAIFSSSASALDATDCSAALLNGCSEGSSGDGSTGGIMVDGSAWSTRISIVTISVGACSSRRTSILVPVA